MRPRQNEIVSMLLEVASELAGDEGGTTALLTNLAIE